MTSADELFTPRELYLMEQAFNAALYAEDYHTMRDYWLNECVADGGVTAAMVLASDADRRHPSECHQKSTSDDGLSEAPVRQYYYKVNNCPARLPSHSDCICWHDEGTGPLPSARDTTESGYEWRDKPQKPTMHPDRKRDTPARREAQQRIIERGQKLRELEAERKAVLHPDNDPHIDAYVLDLNKLPDYETWFETRGSLQLRQQFEPDGMAILWERQNVTTVHELYTHFRARLLDELRQAGILGEK